MRVGLARNGQREHALDHAGKRREEVGGLPRIHQPMISTSGAGPRGLQVAEGRGHGRGAMGIVAAIDPEFGARRGASAAACPAPASCGPATHLAQAPGDVGLVHRQAEMPRRRDGQRALSN